MPELVQGLGLDAFQQRWPWIGPDLQTLRDTLKPPLLPPDQGEPLALAVGDQASLLAMVDPPLPVAAGQWVEPRGLVVLLHGLGGSSEREGLRRMGLSLQAAGFAVWRLNLRGAGPGRPLAPGTYAARCDRDLLPVLLRAREQAGGLPLLGVGISLGGTMLLNAALAAPGALDALVCTSSPLDLARCSQQIEQPRNRVYQRWLLRRLCAQTLADPFGVSAAERLALEGPDRPRTIRAFDAAITAPRWGYGSVEHYYREASPLPRLLGAHGDGSSNPPALPPTLLLHALDDPWVPVSGAQALVAQAPPGVEVVLTARGGHNGFHGVGDAPLSCWGDQLTVRWLNRLLVSGVG
ncbi:MAG: alpha/beta fold hydrolase [Cyanobacteria bacterium M_DeepCast_100m_m1_067]|nr:alpha/beta fold hydrolase [Cyanobacteria bacterium M_DeepCast_100m_m1_067]